MDDSPPDRSPVEPPSAFEYVPLRSDNEIRLVKLSPAKFYEPITCTLVHAPLCSTHHPYEALSYAWGCAEDQVLIKVNGKPFSVTHNLNTALRYLRKERKDNETTLWIDAISINQNDEREKTIQVALMTKIYRWAYQVIAWLGPAGDNSDLIMKFFERAAEEMAISTAKSSGKNKKQRPKPLTISDQLMGDLMDERQNRVRRALEALLEREYWYRTWVVQEILVAREITLVCGTHSVLWYSATTVVEAFVRERNKRIRGNNKTQQVLDEMAEAKRIREQENNRDLRSKRRRPLHLSVETLQMSHHSLKTLGNLDLFRLSPQYVRGPRWLLHMLVALRDFKSKDRRDKIFSLLGLISRDLFESQSSPTPPLDVDYSLDFQTVSTKLFQYYLSAPSEFCRVGELSEPICCWSPLDSVTNKPTTSHQGALNILCASQPTKANGFPSWLADFSRDNGMEPWPILDEQYPDFQCCEPSFSSDHSTIYITGVAVAKIESGHVSGKDDDPLATDELGLICRIKAFMDLAAEYNSTILTLSSFWNALLLKGEEGSEILRYLSAYFRQEELEPKPPELLLQALEDGLTDQEDYVLAFFDTFRRRSFRRRFAIFHMQGNWYPAMVPAASEPGDMLYLLWGCECPVVLREKGNQQDAFEFIGPCCIPGWHVWNRPEDNGLVKTIELH